MKKSSKVVPTSLERQDLNCLASIVSEQFNHPYSFENLLFSNSSQSVLCRHAARRSDIVDSAVRLIVGQFMLKRDN